MNCLNAILHDSGWNVAFPETLSAAALQHQTLPAPLIFYGKHLQDREWRRAVWFLSHLSPRPSVILVSARFDKTLWEEFAQFGGSDILLSPINGDSALRAVEAGWFLWQNQK